MRFTARVSVLAIAAAIAHASVAAAQPAGPAPSAALDKARVFAREAMTLYEAGRYPAAAAAFEKADAAYAAPQYRLYLARSLAKLDKLVGAAQAYDRAIKMPVPAGAAASYVDAQKTAAQELQAIQAQIPVLHVVAARLPSGVRLTLDEVDLPRSYWERIEVDPGRHTLVLSAEGHETVTRKIELARGGVEKVDVTMKPLVLATPQEWLRPVARPAPPAAGRSPNRGVIIAGSALTGGALVAGAVLVGVSASRAGQTESLRGEAVAETPSGCPASPTGKCAELKSTLESRALLMNAGISSFIGAGVAGTATLIYGLAAGRQARTSIRVLPGIGGVWVQGAF